MTIQLHNREQMICEDIEAGRAESNKPKKLYAEITKKLLHLHTGVVDFLHDEYEEDEYPVTMDKYMHDVGKLMGLKAKVKETG